MIPQFDEYLDRFKTAKTESDSYRSRHEQIYDMFMPHRNMYDAAKKTAGQIFHRELYDPTGELALRTHVSQLHVGLTPIGQRFFELEAGSEVPEVDKETVNEEGQKATEIFFKYLGESNFHASMNEAYYDMSAASGALVCNEGPDDNPLLFSAVPLSSYYPEEGPYGTIDTVWREFTALPFRHILRYWPKAKIPDVLIAQGKEQPNFKLTLKEGSIFDPKKKSFHYVVMHEKTRSYIYEETSVSSPWIVFRGFKRSNETHGYGVAAQALCGMQTLNRVYEYELMAAAFRSMPIYLGLNDGVFNPWTVDLQPNTIIPVGTGASPQTPPLFPIPQSGNPEFGQVQVQDLRQLINKIFFTDPLGPMENPPRTATEMMIRNQESLEAKVPFIGRIQVEAFGKLVPRAVYILRKKGLFPPVEVNGKELAIKYRSPIIQSQNLADANKIVQFTQALQSVIGPQMSVAAFDLPDLIIKLAEKMEIPLDVIKTKEEIQQVIEGLQRQAMQQQQAQLPSPPTGGIPQQGAPQ